MLSYSILSEDSISEFRFGHLLSSQRLKALYSVSDVIIGGNHVLVQLQIDNESIVVILDKIGNSVPKPTVEESLLFINCVKDGLEVDTWNSLIVRNCIPLKVHIGATIIVIADRLRMASWIYDQKLHRWSNEFMIEFSCENRLKSIELDAFRNKLIWLTENHCLNLSYLNYIEGEVGMTQPIAIAKLPKLDFFLYSAKFHVCWFAHDSCLWVYDFETCRSCFLKLNYVIITDSVACICDAEGSSARQPQLYLVTRDCVTLCRYISKNCCIEVAVEVVIPPDVCLADGEWNFVVADEDHLVADLLCLSPQHGVVLLRISLEESQCYASKLDSVLTRNRSATGSATAEQRLLRSLPQRVHFFDPPSHHLQELSGLSYATSSSEKATFQRVAIVWNAEELFELSISRMPVHCYGLKSAQFRRKVWDLVLGFSLDDKAHQDSLPVSGIFLGTQEASPFDQRLDVLFANDGLFRAQDETVADGNFGAKGDALDVLISSAMSNHEIATAPALAAEAAALIEDDDDFFVPAATESELRRLMTLPLPHAASLTDLGHLSSRNLYDSDEAAAAAWIASLDPISLNPACSTDEDASLGFVDALAWLRLADAMDPVCDSASRRNGMLESVLIGAFQSDPRSIVPIARRLQEIEHRNMLRQEESLRLAAMQRSSLQSPSQRDAGTSSQSLSSMRMLEDFVRRVPREQRDDTDDEGEFFRVISSESDHAEVGGIPPDVVVEQALLPAIEEGNEGDSSSSEPVVNDAESYCPLSKRLLGIVSDIVAAWDAASKRMSLEQQDAVLQVLLVFRGDVVEVAEHLTRWNREKSLVALSTFLASTIGSDCKKTAAPHTVPKAQKWSAAFQGRWWCVDFDSLVDIEPYACFRLGFREVREMEFFLVYAMTIDQLLTSLLRKDDVLTWNSIESLVRNCPGNLISATMLLHWAEMKFSNNEGLNETFRKLIAKP